MLARRSIESFDDQWVSRHRFSLNYKVEDFGSLTGLGLETEASYNYKTDRLCENRFKPLKVIFTINEQTKFQLYLVHFVKSFKLCIDNL